jgi:hypothetical protein
MFKEADHIELRRKSFVDEEFEDAESDDGSV